MFLFCVSVASVLCLLYFCIISVLKNFSIASGIMLVLICLKDLFWAATGRVSSVSLRVLHHLRLWKGALVLGVFCYHFGMIDQNRGVKDKASKSDWKWACCWRKDTLPGESWRIAAVLFPKTSWNVFSNCL